jgi:hypothetical protein
LSSFFIYNSVGSIDENALQNISLIVNLAKVLFNPLFRKFKSNRKARTKAILRRTFPISCGWCETSLCRWWTKTELRW